ncbi:unnamed protein product, partial [Meganyctiphanes norvegica]
AGVNPSSRCDEAFLPKIGLVNHKITHTGKKQYQSNNAFIQYMDSQKLFETDTGENPNQFSHCVKDFLQNSYLTKHKRTHTGEKSYQCSHCDNNFACNSTLKIHLRKHTGNKPYNS